MFRQQVLFQLTNTQQFYACLTNISVIRTVKQIYHILVEQFRHFISSDIASSVHKNKTATTDTQLTTQHTE